MVYIWDGVKIGVICVMYGNNKVSIFFFSVWWLDILYVCLIFDVINLIFIEIVSGDLVMNVLGNFVFVVVGIELMRIVCLFVMLYLMFNICVIEINLYCFLLVCGICVGKVDKDINFLFIVVMWKVMCLIIFKL